MPDPTRDAFGTLLVSPDKLPRRVRVDVVRRLAGSLQAAPGQDARWLGAALSAWLHQGGDLAAVLGLRPPRGSHATPQAAIRREQRDRLLLRLSVACGGDRPALRVLTGAAPCPAAARGLLADVRAAGAPRSAAAFTRARRRVSADRR